APICVYSCSLHDALPILSDMTLSMHIVVPSGAIPGFPGYDEEHDAIIVFDEGSKKEIDIGDHMLIGTNNSDNKNGPYVEDGSSRSEEHTSELQSRFDLVC